MIECLSYIISTVTENKTKLCRYDFNEPQKGKDACDREAAYLKSRKDAYINSNASNKVTNAPELITSFMFNGGPKNTKAIHLDIDKTKARILNPKSITGIQNYHSFIIDHDTIQCFEYYSIGLGKCYPLKGNINFHSYFI